MCKFNIHWIHRPWCRSKNKPRVNAPLFSSSLQLLLELENILKKTCSSRGKKESQTKIISSYFIRCKNYQVGMNFFFAHHLHSVAPLFGDSHFWWAHPAQSKCLRGASWVRAVWSRAPPQPGLLFARVQIPVEPFPWQTPSPCCPSLIQARRKKKSCTLVSWQFATYLAGPKSRAYWFGWRLDDEISFDRLLFMPSSPDARR